MLAIIVVILVGLFIGAALAHFLGGGGKTRTFATNATVTVTPVPTVLSTDTPAPTDNPAPTDTPATASTRGPRANASTKPSPRAAATSAPTSAPAHATAPPATPTPRPTHSPAAVVFTAPPHTPKPAIVTHAPVSATPVPDRGSSAAAVVRAYVNALSEGQPGAASAYLASGSPDQDSYIDASARLSAVSTVRNADGSYRVQGNLETGTGAYAMTFTVRGGKIIDHVGVKH
ncbi:MAG: hypothetical protein M3Y18_01855 [Candidatus Eremiobacteraeota bacterium]|nr:hypothetical protein [Candidatus Eremiobacteraeota bacterium]